MAKVNTYLIILIVCILLFHFAGLITNTPSSYLLGNLGLTNPENIGSTQFYLLITGVSALAVVGIVAGTVYRSTDMALFGQNILVYGVLALIGMDMIVLFKVVALSSHYLAVIIISPLLITYMFSIYTWLRGMSD